MIYLIVFHNIKSFVLHLNDIFINNNEWKDEEYFSSIFKKRKELHSYSQRIRHS
jgi:hypothetical protein